MGVGHSAADGMGIVDEHGVDVSHGRLITKRRAW